jgi:hypothetical protein
MAFGLLSHFERFANVIFSERERREGRRRVVAIRSIDIFSGWRKKRGMDEGTKV